jgi:ABC-type transporter Mla MlaB component
MPTKTTKRKRASTSEAKPSITVAHVEPPAISSAPAAAEPVVGADPPVAALAQPAAAATSLPVESSGMPTISLSSNCTVKDATAFKDELLQWLDEPGSVAIDAKSVERIDTAIVQLLCAFIRDRAAQNLGVTWVAAPGPLLDAARTLGISTALALPSETAS